MAINSTHSLLLSVPVGSAINSEINNPGSLDALPEASTDEEISIAPFAPPLHNGPITAFVVMVITGG